MQNGVSFGLPYRRPRIAKPEDLPHLGEISALGFKESDVFRYARPKGDEFFQDAVASFTNWFRSQMLDKRALILVTEDWQPNEPDDYDPSFPLTGTAKEGEGKRVVVGVSAWYLPQESRRVGKFVSPAADVPDEVPSEDRDLCKERLDIFRKVKDEAECKYFKDIGPKNYEIDPRKSIRPTIICNKIVVHPAFQRLGHATAMLRWIQQLCNCDCLKQGVISPRAVEPLFRKVGYETIGEMQVPDDGDVRGFTQHVMWCHWIPAKVPV
ncbi:hypothetical protein QBC35DRAFT_473962 [Podospora australis]|uniref:Uncharacterized protein n=1 Tax=Podospora australis TaxID=1536484 RepID=A0AAN6WTH2_9PEZI|nr:hypothetical protein QBC35DRAFT_473962 [Podospora australis]